MLVSYMSAANRAHSEQLNAIVVPLKYKDKTVNINSYSPEHIQLSWLLTIGAKRV